MGAFPSGGKRRKYATNVAGTLAAPAGHYVQEEAPKETLEAMLGFFAD
jgi:haloacetate dehalogenase